MKAASEILERRRSERRGTAFSGSTSRYVAADYSLPFPAPDHYGTSATERGRPISRYSLPLQPPPSTRSYRSSSGSTTSSSGSDTSGAGSSSGSGAGGTGSGNSLWGLLDMAQSWILTHTSRRDRSEERSRYLLRKTKQVWLWLICEQIIVYISWFFLYFEFSFIQNHLNLYKQTSK